MLEYPGVMPSEVLQPTIVAGEGGVRSREDEQLDLLYVDRTNPAGDPNRPFFFGSNTPAKTLINTPYSDGPFWGYRQVLVSKYKNTENCHLLTVLIFEIYPVPGRVWGNTLDLGNSQWVGWHGTAMQ